MNQKKNEPFNPNMESGEPSGNLEFKKAGFEHIKEIFELMFLRNPEMDREKLLKRTEKEVIELNDGVDYGVFVALLNSKVVGFCRFYNSQSVPKDKIKFPALEGFYCMGMMVDSKFRRQGVAKYLSGKRFEWLRTMDVKETYSVVAIDNPTSINMHKSFGFVEIDRAEGFLTISFECGEGLLFKKKIV